MHHTVIWIHPDRTPAKPLMTNRAMPVLVNHHPSVQPTGHHPAELIHLAIAQQHSRFNRHFFNAAQLGHYALFVQHTIGIAYAAQEVRLKLFDWKSRRNEIERC